MGSTYFEMAGHLIELESIYQEFSGVLPSKDAKLRTQNAKSVLTTAKAGVDLARSIAGDDGLTWSNVGAGVGFGLGVTQAILTSPLTLVDGVLPIADAVWWAANIKATQRYTFTGAKIGSYIDDRTGLTPGRIYQGVKPPSRKDVRGF